MTYIYQDTSVLLHSPEKYGEYFLDIEYEDFNSDKQIKKKKLIDNDYIEAEQDITDSNRNIIYFSKIFKYNSFEGES